MEMPPRPIHYGRTPLEMYPSSEPGSSEMPNSLARALAVLLTAAHSEHTMYPAPAFAHSAACYYFLLS